MKFGKFLSHEVAPLLQTEPLKYFAPSIIRYRSLKKLLRKIDADTLAARSGAVRPEGECAICLEAFPDDSCCHAVRTKCRHWFHYSCLAHSFGTRRSAQRCCPLCRAPPDELLPDGPEGLILQFLSNLCSNVEAVERSHAAFLADLIIRFRAFQLAHSSLSFFERSSPLSHVRQSRCTSHDVDRSGHRQTDPVVR